MLSKLIYIAVMVLIFILFKKVVNVLHDNQRSQEARKRFKKFMDHD